MSLLTEEEEKHREICENISALMEKQLSMMMSTINSVDHPYCSYSPFVLMGENDDTSIFCFISDLSSHTENLRHKPLASLMFIEDELECKSIYTRRRLTLDCSAHFIERSDKAWESCLIALEQRHGEIVKLLRNLSDFHLVRFESQSGHYVQGFGEAYKFNGFDLSSLEHNRPIKETSE